MTTNIHQVRGLSNSGKIELPCLVDQVNCGEVYYITWTKQALASSSSLNSFGFSNQNGSNTLLAAAAAAASLQQTSLDNKQWNRVYLYTGANDSSPHKPIGDLISRATFKMPNDDDDNNDNDNNNNKRAKYSQKSQLFDDDIDGNLARKVRQQQQQQQQELPWAHLVIEEPKISDEALYKCDVTYVKGKCPSISLVRVQILALPAKAQINLISPAAAAANNADVTFQQQQQQQQLQQPLNDGQIVGPFNENDQLKLTCLVQGGRPQVRSIIWRKIDPSNGRVTNLLLNSVVKNNNNKDSIQIDLNYTLGKFDLGSRFECHIEHDAIDYKISLLNNMAATTKRLQQQQQLSLSIAETNSDSMLDIHPSIKLPSSSSSSSSLTIENQSNENELINSKFSLDSYVIVDLNVGVSSLDLFMARVNKINSSELLKEGDLVELECIAYNSKPAANITWFNGNELIEQLVVDSRIQQNLLELNGNHQRHKRLLQRNQVHQNDDGLTFNTHSFLSIKLSRHEHKTQISCQAQNSQMKQPLVKSLELQVQHTPIVLMEPASGIVVSEQEQQQQQQQQQRSLESLIGKNQTGSWAKSSTNNNNNNDNDKNQVNIYCIYSANPAELMPNSTSWFKDGLPLNLNDNQQHFSESFTQTGYPVLTINQVNRKDAGYYDCQVANSIGLSERLPSNDACKLEVNFKPTVGMRLFKFIVDQQKQQQHQQPQRQFKISDDLIELDLNQELILPGNSYILICDVIEAQPNKIQKFYWFKRPLIKQLQQQQQNRNQDQNQNQNQKNSIIQEQLLSISEFNQLVLNPLSANFTPSSYACSASNSLGVSDFSNRIDLQLSYTPGPSFVRPIIDATHRRTILLASGKASLQQQPVISTSSSSTDNNNSPIANDVFQQQQQQPGTVVEAGKEFLLECVTQDLGQPKANIWLWFKNGQPIESLPNLISQSSSSYNNNINDRNFSTTTNNNNNRHQDELISRNNNNSNNPIIRGNEEELLSEAENKQRRASNSASSQDTSSNIISLLGSGRYLFIPSIQLAHKGNYSCVAVNRLGSGPQNLNQNNNNNNNNLEQKFLPGERDSYQIRVALAPSFIKPLTTKSYWSEETLSSSNSNSRTSLEFELICHVQCEPMCQIEWFKNNELLDFRKQTTLNGAETNNNYIQYLIKQTILDENLEANLFKSVESRLILRFNDLKDSQMKKLERRNLIDGSNYTCQSTANSIGPSVRSTTKFIIQYPPKNVIINAPSDKLSLIEGSNGPKLICGASAEPQAQYRWFLVRGGNINTKGNNKSDSILYKTKNNNNLKSSSIIERSNFAATTTLPPVIQSIKIKGPNHLGQPINQLDKKVSLQRIEGGGGGAVLFKSFFKSANDATNIGGEILDSNNLIELTSSATQQTLVGGTVTSILDLSNISLDRRQIGNYICEASNRFGQKMQSVYLNIQYKPTCATLHLHSLDMIMAPSSGKLAHQNNDINNNQQQSNYIQFKPNEATTNDEYSIVKESNEDYIDLRKMLITSPSIHNNRFDLTSSSSSSIDSNGQYNFKDSIFQTILNDKKNFDLTIGSNNNAQLKTKNALIHTDDNDNNNNENDNQNSENNGILSDNNVNKGDSWDKFNEILLKFLNNYVKQVKDHENKFVQEINNSNRRKQVYSRQNRRSQTNEQITSNSINNENYEFDFSVKNLITFACMAQDANPMNNLTFDWYFGPINIKENLLEDNNDNIYMSRTNDFDLLNKPEVKFDENKKPILLYSNENYTLHVVLVRRLDTRNSLNPFQMSLLTLNVILEPQGIINNQQQQSSRNVRQQQQQQFVEDTNNKTFRAPVIRNRYQSLYNSVNNLNANKNNIQFTQEFYTKPYNAIQSTTLNNNNNNYGIELNEQNWEEQLGNLLKCSVSNQIGVSDVCPAKLNINERLKSKGLSPLGSSTTFEFAKWRMPSLAQKSILIVCISFACTLIITATLALILCPYIKDTFVMKYLNHNSKDNNSNDDGNGSNKADSNTGQSTSSQKSSVLGLLENNSTQGSSDDDSTARITNQNHHHHNHKISLAITDIMINKNNIDNSYQYNHNSNYDEPRNSVSYIHTTSNNDNDNDNGIMMSYNERTPDAPNSISINHPSTYRAYQSQLNGFTTEIGNNKTSNNKELGDVDLKNYIPIGTSASKLLANLKIKSLSSRFKVDRISDITNSFRGNLHSKNNSNSETITTGLSSNYSMNDNNNNNNIIGVESTATTVSKLISPSSSNTSSTTTTFFGDSNLRHSYSGSRQSGGNQTTSLRRQNAIPTLFKQSNHYYDQNGLMQNPNELRQFIKLNQRNSAILNQQTPTYLNMSTSNNDNENDPMERFIQQREIIAANESFYRSQSIRDHQQASISVMNMLSSNGNDLTQQQQQQLAYQQHQQELHNFNRGPPIYPRTMYSRQINYNGIVGNDITMLSKNQRPQIAARTRNHLLSNNTLDDNNNNNQYRYSMNTTNNNNNNNVPSVMLQQYNQNNIDDISTYRSPVISTISYNHDTIDTHLSRPILDTSNTSMNNYYQNRLQLNNTNYANSNGVTELVGNYNEHDNLGYNNQIEISNNETIEHIYDTNAYATPEQTPLKKFNQQTTGNGDSDCSRAKVSQLIQSFNSKAPE